MSRGPREVRIDALPVAPVVRAAALQQHPPSPSERRVAIASYLLMGIGLLLVMLRGLLPGLLCVCIGFLATRWFAGLIVMALVRIRPAWQRPDGASPFARAIAATLAVLLPIGLLALAFSESRELILDAPNQYRELIDYIARTILELRLKLPQEIAAYLPEGADEVQRMIATYLRERAGILALAGRGWLEAVLFAYVGLIIGAIAAAGQAVRVPGPLVEQLHRRIRLFGEAFRQIVAAQFWIAAFNATLTSLFLLALLPLWNIKLPYAPALIALTFVAGMIPIVGNLVCNTVLTLVGLSVSPAAAAACLVFLIVIHKAEYVINAKVVGSRTHMAVWELLAVMFVAEAVFGPAGLVAAPLFYAYLKKELEAARLV
jgi:predicted PurR-regulated permease PerM